MFDLGAKSFNITNDKCQQLVEGMQRVSPKNLN
jgi:hypothetical protein